MPRGAPGSTPGAGARKGQRPRAQPQPIGGAQARGRTATTARRATISATTTTARPAPPQEYLNTMASAEGGTTSASRAPAGGGRGAPPPAEDGAPDGEGFEGAKGERAKGGWVGEPRTPKAGARGWPRSNLWRVRRASAEGKCGGRGGCASRGQGETSDGVFVTPSGASAPDGVSR